MTQKQRKIEEQSSVVPSRRSRRRGSELNGAIYNATIDLLEKKGYEAVTFQNVAQLAHTTRSVIYRYWDNNFSLIYEAARYHIEKNPNWHGAVIDQVFNTGSLREDLITMATYTRENSKLYPKNFLSFIFFEQSQGKGILDNMVSEITNNNLIIVERILARAQERGEARETIGQTAKVLPFQILRYHIMIGGDPITDKDIIALVDEVLLPIYKKEI